MADATNLIVNGQLLAVADAQARVQAAAGLDLGSRLSASARNQGGRSLDELFAAEIAAYPDFWTWIADRTYRRDFTGILPGDYHDYTMGDASTRRARIHHVMPYYRCADTDMGPHLAWGFDDAFGVTGSLAVNGDHIMWKSDNNNGTSAEKHPYLLSNPHAYLNSTFYNLQPAELRAILIQKRQLLEERYSTAGAQTAATGWSFADMGYFWCPSVVEVFGHESWATKGYAAGIDCQFDWYRTTANRIKFKDGARASWWLCSPDGSNSTSACSVHSSGSANSYSVTGTYIYLSPGFLTGGKAAEV